MKGYAAPETLAALERARELIEQTEDDSRQDAVLTGLFVAYFNRAEFRKAHEVGVQFLDVAERQDETAPKCIGHRMVAASLNAMGDFRPALPHAEAAVVLYDPELHGPLAWRYVHDLGVAALNHWASRSGTRVGRTTRSPASAKLSSLPTNSSTSTRPATRYSTAAPCRRSVAGISPSCGASRHVSRLTCGSTRCRTGPHSPCASWGRRSLPRGKPRRASTYARTASRFARATGTKAFLPAFLAGLAEAQLAAGRPEQAERTIVTALRMSRRTAERWMDAELWRLAGQASVLSGRHAPGRAERLFRRAAGCAELQGSRRSTCGR